MVIIGLGGLTKDILSDLLQQYTAAELLFYTEVNNDTNLPFFIKHNLNVAANAEAVKQHFELADKRFIVIIGNNAAREALVTKYTEWGGVPHYFISKSANVNEQLADISTINTVIMHNALVSAGATVGPGVIISQNAYVGPEAVLHKYAFLCAFSGLSSGSIGEYAFVGLKTAILPGRTIGKNALVGAFTMVNKSIPDNAKAYGIPAKVAGK